MPQHPTISPGDDVRVLLQSCSWLNDVTSLVGGGAPPQTGAASQFGARFPFICRIKNDSGVDVGRYGILGIDGPLFTKTDNENFFLGSTLQFKGVKPKAEHAGRVAICLGPIANGKMYEAIIPNAVQVKVNITATGHRFASIIDDDITKLESGASGTYPMVPAETGAGVKWAVVFLVAVPQRPLQFAEATTGITAATGWTPATWGTGTVQPKDEEGNNAGPPIAVRSKYRDPFDVKSIVLIDRNFDPARVCSVGCTPAP